MPDVNFDKLYEALSDLEPDEPSPLVEDERICPFCGQFMDEDDEMVPVYIGEQDRSGGTEFLSETASPTFSDANVDKERLLLDAVREAAKTSDNIDIGLKRHVDRIQGPAFGEITSNGKDFPEMKTERAKNEVAAEIKIRHQTQKREPDLMVCSYCEDAFK